jgi:hypothetical protein
MNDCECVICYNKTDNKLRCNHIVCQKCEQKLNKNNKIICPLCRKEHVSFKFANVETPTGFKRILLITIKKYVWTNGFLKHLNQVMRQKYTNPFMLLRYRKQVLFYNDYQFIDSLPKVDLEFFVYREVLLRRHLNNNFVKELFSWFLDSYQPPNSGGSWQPS